ncbi:hypothetical protein DH2020_046485 [Rehmannia glutinosa]|uniref:Uncharacterized protein n=1 Tax=Rehmannia glutinosa TaxID=99300 RepID=A0ABR0UBS7_REHGL
MANLNNLDFTLLDISGRNYLFKKSFRTRKSLKDRFDHQKTVILPRARYEWMQLRLQDLKQSVITIRACLELYPNYDFVEKLLLMEICWRKLTPLFMHLMSYSMKISTKGFYYIFSTYFLFIGGQENNDLSMQNHQAQPTGSTTLRSKFGFTK